MQLRPVQSPAAVWVTAFFLPFVSQLLIELPTGVGDKILHIPPHPLGIVVYYAVIVSPSYAFLWFMPSREANRVTRLAVFTVSLAVIIPLVMIMSVFVGCYIFNACI